MGESVPLKDLLEFTRDGEWGMAEPHGDLVEMAIIRGTDFAAVRRGDVSTVPTRFINRKASNRKTLKPGDLLIETAGGTKDQPTGRTVYLPERVFNALSIPVTCASFSRFLRVKQELLNPKYLFWYLQSIYSAGEMLPYHIQHTGVARFQYTDFASQWQIPLPPLYEQEAIADTLSLFDDKIELNRRMNETLEAMARAIFKDWFVDFGPTRAKAEGREPYLAPELWELFPDALDEEGKPVGWGLSTVGLKAETRLGGTPSRKRQEFWGGDVPWINSGKVNEFRVTSAAEFITTRGFESSSTKLLPKRTTLIAITGATLGKVSLNEIEVCANQSIVGVVGNEEVPGEFLYLWVVENIGDLLATQTGAAQQHINKGNINDLLVLCPSRNVTEAWIEVARPIFDEIAVRCFENETLSQTRDLLLPKLMSGDVRLRDAEKAVDAVA